MVFLCVGFVHKNSRWLTFFLQKPDGRRDYSFAKADPSRGGGALASIQRVHVRPTYQGRFFGQALVVHTKAHGVSTLLFRMGALLYLAKLHGASLAIGCLFLCMY